MSIRFECFGMTILKATALDLKGPQDDFAVGGVLILALPNKGKISLFMPYETALEYSTAINACNDRETIESVPSMGSDHEDPLRWL